MVRSGLAVQVALIVFVMGSASVEADNSVVRELRFEPVHTDRSRTVPVKIYLRSLPTAQPVVLFSHGLGGSREDNAYLGRYWAAAGYVAVFMQHAGSDESVWKSVPAGQRVAALKAAASVSSFLQRNADVSFVIDKLAAWNRSDGHELRGQMNLDQIGMSGHSFGAVTTLAVAGRKFPFDRSFPDDRIDAFLAMSPQPGKGLDPKEAFGRLASPILCMTGTKDSSPINPTLPPLARQEVYAALPPGDKYQLVLKDGEHSAFSDSRRRWAKHRDPAHHPAIQKISLMFWNAYLKGNAEAEAWLQSKKPIKNTGLNDGNVWEWKE